MFLIVGNGALGVALGTILRSYEFEVGYFGRSGPVALDGVPVGGQQPTILFAKPPSQDDLRKCVAVFVAVKAYDLREALFSQLQRLSESGIFCPVIPIGNGQILSILDRAREAFPKFGWRLGVTTIASAPMGDGGFLLSNEAPKLSWGTYPAGGEPTLCEERLLRTAPHIFRWEADPVATFRRKWVFNTTLNSFCAARELATNGDALAQGPAFREVFDEAFSLAGRQWSDFSLNPDALYEELAALVQTTRANTNSMTQDLKLGRHTETDFLAGVALKHDGFPRLKKLHETISALERGESR